MPTVPAAGRGYGAPVSRSLRPALAVAAVAAACSSPAAVTGGAAVERVIDGDSVELRIEGELVEARLIGINAPELADCQGPAARDALAELVEDRALSVESFGRDRFGRELVALGAEGEDVNQALVERGWALALHDGEGEAWLDAMADAASRRLGMWGMDEDCPPPSATVVIADVEPDPPGPDDEVLDQEWIELENRGADPVELAGWAVRDESTTNRYVFGEVTLPPGGRIRLRTGSGADAATEIYWDSPAGVWSNRGETALLLAPSGAIVDHRFLG